MVLQTLKSGTDIRGRAQGDKAALTEGVVSRIGFAFARYLIGECGIASPRVAIGRDSRVTGESLLAACVRGLAAGGAQVCDFALCTTPAMYMCLLTQNWDASVMVTASHHPADRNGLKFFLPDGGVSGDVIGRLLSDAEALPPDFCAPEAAAERCDYLPIYRRALEARIRDGLNEQIACPLLGLHVLVDAGSGAGGFYADLLKDLGAWVEGSQFLTPDGTFPGHIPNPEAPEAMASLSAAVLKYGADLGVIFDADCDRAAIVDSLGREINRNRLIALISAILLNKIPGATIVTDSVTSSGLATFIQEWGGVHYRFKRGYRNVIDEAIRLNESGVDCPLAIETSGHAALRENHFLDDGMYLVTVLIVEAMRLKREGKLLGSLLDGLREPAESVELRLPILCEDFREAGRALVERVLDFAAFAPGWHIATDNREGVRIAFDLDGQMNAGWFLLRMSVHDPVMPLNVESDVPGGLRDMLAKLLSLIGDTQDVDTAPIQIWLDQHSREGGNP